MKIRLSTILPKQDTYVGGNLKEKFPIMPLGSSENLKERQLRSAKPISLGYWYSMMYHKPMN